MDPESPLFRLLGNRYASTKPLYPTEGRRKCVLRVLEQFWALSAEARATLLQSLPTLTEEQLENADFLNDDDPYDEVSIDSDELGIILRTDYSNEAAWETFHALVLQGEQEFVSEDTLANDVKMEEPGDPSSSTQESEDQEMDASAGDSDNDGMAPAIFKIISPQTPLTRAPLTNISNLTALRLLSTPSIRPSPALPADTKRIKPPNRLVDDGGWQEVYEGKNIWIYDDKSNADGCVRVVSGAGDMYGTATGDSWRARATHICELQVNLYSGAMKIDFGGLDRWDYSERKRNMEEAVKPIS